MNLVFCCIVRVVRESIRIPKFLYYLLRYIYLDLIVIKIVPFSQACAFQFHYSTSDIRCSLNGVFTNYRNIYISDVFFMIIDKTDDMSLFEIQKSYS